jgi:hypothetical protein
VRLGRFDPDRGSDPASTSVIAEPLAILVRRKMESPILGKIKELKTLQFLIS